MDYSLTKIANELGISKSTVSLVLNGKARSMRISEEVEKRVKDFCKEVNYVPNIHAQRINRKRAGNIGFLVNRGVRIDENNPFSDANINGILGGIVIAAENIGSRVSVQLYSGETEYNRVFDWLRNHEIDGLIYYGTGIPEEWKKTFTDEERCVVGIGTEPDTKISTVNIDNFMASSEMAKYLIEKGKKRFAYFSGIDGTFVSDERKRGFLSTLMENGIEVKNENLISADFSELIAEKKILEHLPEVDAIACANDDMAIGVINALKKLNVRVPEDIAVTGADNIPASRYLTPALTTFNGNQYELGSCAVNSVIQLLEGHKASRTIVPTELVIRESV